MDRILEVTKILYKNTQSVVFDTPPHRSIEDVAKQINQLYEPLLDKDTEKEIKQGLKEISEGKVVPLSSIEPQPDQSRLLMENHLLTDKELHKAFCAPLAIRYGTADDEAIRHCIRIVKEECAKSASIAVQSEHEYMIKRCVDEGNDAYKRGVEVEWGKSQARIEEIFNWIKGKGETPLGADSYGYYIWKADLENKIAELKANPTSEVEG